MIAVTDRFPPVTVIIPSAGLARYTTFEMSIEALHVPDGGGLQRGISASLASSVNEALRTTHTPFYWFIDDDHQFEPTILLRLIAHDVPAVVPLTVFSRPPFQPVLFKATELVGRHIHHADLEERVAEIAELMRRGYVVQGQQKITELINRGPVTRPRQRYTLFTWDDLDREAGLFKLPLGGRVGRSGLLIKREVIDAIPDPWFELGQTNPEEPGEDMLFAEKIQRAGFDLFVDLEQVNGHTSPATAFPTRDAETGRWGIRIQWENDRSVFLPRWPLGGQTDGAGESSTHATPPAPTHACTDGWVCEQHPERPFPHDLADGTSCAGPAAACTVPGCRAWEART